MVIGNGNEALSGAESHFRYRYQKDAALVLDGTLNVKIRFNGDITKEDGWKVNGKEIETNGESIFVYSTSAKNFKDDIIITKGSDIFSRFSIDKMLKRYADISEIEDIANAITDYCTAAEAYFSGNGSVADYSADWENIKLSIGEKGNINMGENYYGTTLLLKSGMILRHYYTSKTENVEYTGEKNGCFYIDKTVPAHRFSDLSEYGVNDYIYRVLSSEETSDDLKNLCAAIFYYGSAAEIYADQY